jgi:hypothetical protein
MMSTGTFKYDLTTWTAIRMKGLVLHDTVAPYFKNKEDFIIDPLYLPEVEWYATMLYIRNEDEAVMFRLKYNG